MSKQDNPDTDTILECDSLTVSYGKVTALRGIDVQIPEGEMVAVIGPNGAGKSTLANAISGLVEYDGRIQYRGMEVASVPVHQLVSKGLVHCTEKHDLFPYLSVEKNLRLGAFCHREDIESQRSFVYELFPVLEERSNQHAKTLSGGEQQMLALGRALMSKPDLLLLDEPTLGLAPVVLDAISDGLNQIMSEGITILLCEQNVTFAFEHASHIMLLENGEIVRQGTPDELQNDEYVTEVYTGG